MRLGLLLGIAVLGLSTTGCGSHGNPSVAPATPTVSLSGSATSAGRGSILWRKDSLPVALPKRWVMLDGNVGVTESGCFTLGDAVLWADQRSHIVSNGTAIRLTGLGTFKIGDHVDAAGFFYRTKTTSTLSPTPRQCADGRPTMAVASLYSPHTMHSMPPCLNENKPPFC